MDSAARNLAALAAIATVLMAEAVCGLVAYVFVPLLGGAHPFCIACLLPAIILSGLLAASLWLGARKARGHLLASRTGLRAASARSPCRQALRFAIVPRRPASMDGSTWSIPKRAFPLSTAWPTHVSQ